MDVRIEALGVGFALRRPLLTRLTTYTAVPGLTVLAGINGSGKTTLLRIPATELRPRQGRVGYYQDGQEITSLRDVRSPLGWVPQHSPFDPAVPAKQAVASVGAAGNAHGRYPGSHRPGTRSGGTG